MSPNQGDISLNGAGNYNSQDLTEKANYSRDGIFGNNISMYKKGSDTGYLGIQYSTEASLERHHELEFAKKPAGILKAGGPGSIAGIARAVGNIGSAAAHAKGQIGSAVAHTVGNIFGAIANVIGVVIKSKNEMISRLAEADSAKKQKFFNMAASDSTEYYRSNASIVNTKYNYKNQQKQRRHETRLQKRNIRYNKSQNKRRWR